MSAVAIVRCASYDPKSVRAAVTAGLDMLPGVETLFPAGEQILIKPNLLAAVDSSRAVTTHPRVFEAVAEWLRARGSILSYGDSPAVVKPARAARKSGIADVAERLAIPLADFTHGIDVPAPQGSMIRQFRVARGAKDAHGIVSIPKMKTHMFTTITGAVKNVFGIVPGLHKSAFHAQFPDPDTFSRMLVDLVRTMPPRLHIMDGVIAMEGPGPGGGDPVAMGVMLFSTDPFALDFAVTRMMGVDAARVPVLKWGVDYGLFDAGTIEYPGASPDDFHHPGYRVPEPGHRDREKSFLVRTARNHVVQRPVIDAKRCVRCHHCVQICPVTPKALTERPNKPPVYDYSRCIRCFCCQEVCPESAITVRKPLLGKILYGLISRE